MCYSIRHHIGSLGRFIAVCARDGEATFSRIVMAAVVRRQSLP